MIKINDKLEDFSLPNQDNKTVKLSDFLGKIVLVYFYPKDNTPGCTLEACGIRDNFIGFEKIQAVVLGISADSVESHKKFKDKYKLPFDLLADVDKKVSNYFDVWQEKSIFGKKFEGIKRTSFLIDKEGRLVKIYENVKPLIHYKQVLADINIMLK